MNAVLAVARREVQERKRLLLVGLVLAGVALPIGLWPELGHRLDSPSAPVRALACAVIAAILGGLAYPPAVALALGASAFAEDAASGRLSFWFSRPLSAWQLWAGKWLGALGIVIVACLTAGVASLLALGGPGQPTGGGVGWQGLGSMFLLVVSLMPIGHLAASSFRSRDHWLGVDLAMTAIALGVLGSLGRELVLLSAGPVLFHLVPWTLAVLLVAGSVASLVQLSVGRADVRRGRAALCLAFWGTALAGLAAFAAWGSSLRHVTPAQVGGAASPVFAGSGPAVVFRSGDWRGHGGFAPDFLLDADSGRSVPLSSERAGLPVFDAQGRTALWVTQPLDAPFFRDRPTLAVGRLGAASPELVELPIAADWDLALAADRQAERVVVTGASRTAVLDARTGQVIARRTRPARAARFLPDGTVRLWVEGNDLGDGIAIVDWNASAGTEQERLRVPGRGVKRVEHLGDRAALVYSGERVLVDVATGTLLRFPGASVLRPLAAGGALVVQGREARRVEEDGTVLWSQTLPVPCDAATENQAGQVALGLYDPRRAPFWRTVVLDAASGKTLREVEGFYPLGAVGDLPEPGSVGSSLFTDFHGGLIRVGAGGTRHVLVEAE